MSQLVSICTYTYNEKENIKEFYEEIKKIFNNSKYDYELIISDNASTDGTEEFLKNIAKENKKVKVLLNENNFGSEINSYTSITNSAGDIAIALPSDMQIPLTTINDLLLEYEKKKINVIYLQYNSKKNFLSLNILKLVYFIFNFISDYKIPIFCEGSGLYTKKVIEQFRNISERKPFMRTLAIKLGFSFSVLKYNQNERVHGKSSTNFKSLVLFIISGYFSNSTFIIKLNIFLGSIISFVCIIISLYYLINKIIYWDTFSAGIAPIIIGFFLISGLQIFFIGIFAYHFIKYTEDIKFNSKNIFKEKINF